MTENTNSEQDARLKLTQNVMDMLQNWGLGMEHIKQLMALDTPLRKMDRFCRDQPFPNDEQTNLRIEHLVGIAEGLRTAYPRNSKMGKVWLQQPHRKFGRRAPLEVMVTDGLDGMIYVRAEIDCTFAWEATNAGFQ